MTLLLSIKQLVLACSLVNALYDGLDFPPIDLKSKLLLNISINTKFPLDLLALMKYSFPRYFFYKKGGQFMVFCLILQIKTNL